MKTNASPAFCGHRLRLLPAGAPLLPVTVPELLLLAVVVFLFVQLFRSCVSNKKGTETVQQLMRRLLQLEQKLETARPIDPLAERRELEQLLNRVKVSNPATALSSDPQLRYHVTRSYNLISERSLQVTPAEHVPWTQLDALLQDFYGSYFSVLPALRHDPAAAPSRHRRRSTPTEAPL